MVYLFQWQLVWFRKQRIMGNIHRSVVIVQWEGLRSQMSTQNVDRLCFSWYENYFITKKHNLSPCVAAEVAVPKSSVTSPHIVYLYIKVSLRLINSICGDAKKGQAENLHGEKKPLSTRLGWPLTRPTNVNLVTEPVNQRWITERPGRNGNISRDLRIWACSSSPVELAASSHTVAVL